MSSNINKQDETPLKLIFLPFPEAGHMIHMSDLAKTISSHNNNNNGVQVQCTIVTTPANLSFFNTSQNPHNLFIHTLNFPGPTFGLPKGVENFNSVNANESSKLYEALSMLRKPIEDLIREIEPDCIISDPFYTWSVDLACEIQVPRIFPMIGSFSKCCDEIIKVHTPHEGKNDEDLMELPLFPHKIVMKVSQIPKWVRIQNFYTRLRDSIRESKLKSYGALSNSFPCDFEKEYDEFYEKLTGLKVWNIGPLCMHVTRNEECHVPVDETLLKWLDQKKPGSVLYVSFGSMVRFPDDQLREIASGLESSDHDFIWVVRKKNTMEENWSLEEFRKRMEESKKGYIIENWGPQVKILKHKAIGGMVTHCGWNSILEGVTIGGVPLVTWPLFAEQFYNERYVVDVLKVGVSVGVNVWCEVNEIGMKEIVKREKIEVAIREVMGESARAIEMKVRAMEIREGSQKAVENGGSSKANLVAFLDDLKAIRVSKVV